MRIRHIIICCMLSWCGGISSLLAQDSKGNYCYADETQLWRLTANAAALSLDCNPCDSTANRGIAYFDLSHRDGDYHRVQEGSMDNSLQFFTERYQKIGRYLYGYGSFHFDMGRIKNRAWSDVIRTYNSNPFISGSSVSGSYDHQNFELLGRLSTVSLGHFTYGADLLYRVGDLSRIRDPRSRVNLAEYRIAPSATYTTGRTTLAIAAHYDRRKEKLPNLTTVQTDPSLKYYIMTGLENAEGAIALYQGYMREYVNHEFGAEMGFGYSGDRLHSVNTFSVATGREYVYGTNKYQPGEFRTLRYGLTSRNRIQQGSLLHSADIGVSYGCGYADEFKEERVTTKDAETGETSVHWNRLLTYKKRYQQKAYDVNLHYRLSFTDDERVAAYAGLRYQLQGVVNKHVVHTSQLKYSSSQIELEGGIPVMGNRLWIEATGRRHFSHKASLELYDPTTDYALNVLIPDMNYYQASYWQGRLELTWQQPLVIKGMETRWFAKLYGSYLRTDNSLDGRMAGLSVGLYY